ncbi:mycofactocin biosynthesis chaperone MftB [Iamia sp. SCSIO 61187]|uniref:mycofactocin biosynthesis chaperone MftB n=1 Tax=Iamia sp. SCSIO 61187 TaxID=2722752 RepID=UPI001C62C104|nr:mycofactocin biosynthesis chaperone MftB [Iamia sp. SCSIO 61187]
MLDEAWGLDDAVSLRPEPFGALAYHFGTRKLSFLKVPPLVDVVTGLAGAPTVADALVAAGIEESLWPQYLTALRTLADSGMIVPRTPVPAGERSEWPERNVPA